MPEEIYDKEFYIVVWDSDGIPNHTFVHLRNGETIWNYMLRVHQVSHEKIDQIYKRTFARQ